MWNPCRSVSALVGLAVEAIEAVAFMFDFSDPADRLYGEACAALADKEARCECDLEGYASNGFHAGYCPLWHEYAHPESSGRGCGNDVSQGAEQSSGAAVQLDSRDQESFPASEPSSFPLSECVSKPKLRKWCCGTVVPGPHAEGCTLTPRNGFVVSSAASGAAPTVSGSPVEARAAQPCPPTKVGQSTPLTPRELADAAYAVRGFALTSPVPDGWEALADRLTALAAE